MSWILFFQIVILAMLFYIVAYALIETYLQKQFDKVVEFHDVTHHKDYDKSGG